MEIRGAKKLRATDYTSLAVACATPLPAKVNGCQSDYEKGDIGAIR